MPLEQHACDKSDRYHTSPERMVALYEWSMCSTRLCQLCVPDSYLSVTRLSQGSMTLYDERHFTFHWKYQLLPFPYWDDTVQPVASLTSWGWLLPSWSLHTLAGWLSGFLCVSVLCFVSLSFHKAKVFIISIAFCLHLSSYLILFYIWCIWYNCVSPTFVRKSWSQKVKIKEDPCKVTKWKWGC